MRENLTETGNAYDKQQGDTSRRQGPEYGDNDNDNLLLRYYERGELQDRPKPEA